MLNNKYTIMKKLLFALLLSQLSFGQTITKQLKDFQQLLVHSAISVELIPAEENKIELLGELATRVTVNQDEENQVKLSLPIKQKFKSNAKAKLYYKTPFKFISLANSAKVYSNAYMETTFIELKGTTNAAFNLFLKTEDIKVGLTVGAEATLKGKTDTQTVKLKTKSCYNCLDFISNKAFVTASSGSKAGVYVNKTLDATAKYKSTISYDGNVYAINETIKFKSSVEKVKTKS